MLKAIRRETLTTAELAGVVGLWLGCAAEQRQQECLLRHPREALSQAKGTCLQRMILVWAKTETACGSVWVC